MAKNLSFVNLLEVYGSVLTEKQRNVMELYYWEDLSLGEIAECSGITRQGVRDSIKRGEQVLSELEEKLKITEKILKCRECFAEIGVMAAKLDCHEEEAKAIIATAMVGREIF